MGQRTLKKRNSKFHELLTETLDENKWWPTIHLIVQFLRSEGVKRVNVEYGFVMDRDFDGLEQGKDKTVPIADLEQLIVSGVKEKTIEFKSTSDFIFESEDRNFAVMLCNDGDIHFASQSQATILTLGRKIKSNGIKVYDSGNPI